MDRRLRVLAALVLVVGVGLASRRYDGLFPRMLGKYPGDALWTVAAYLGWKLVLPSMGPRGLRGGDGVGAVVPGLECL